MKTTLWLLLVFILVLCGGYALNARMNAQQTTASAYSSESKASSTSAQASSTASVPAAGTSVTATSYTSAQVASHGTNASCWTSISGNVYDLTSWIAQHPGGVEAILSICGKDGTSAFLGQHGNDNRAQSTLATFKIGTLAS